MAQPALLVQLDNLQAELHLAHARNNRLVVALDEMARISLRRLAVLRVVQERDGMIADLQQSLAQKETALMVVEQRENMLAGAVTQKVTTSTSC